MSNITNYGWAYVHPTLGIGLTRGPADSLTFQSSSVPDSNGMGTASGSTNLTFKYSVSPSLLELTGNLIVNGEMSCSSNLTIDGNLTVNGTNTIVNSTTLQIDDKQIELAHSPAGSEGDDVSVNDGGMVLKSSATDKSILYNNANTSWKSSENIETATGKHVMTNKLRALNADGLHLQDDGGNGIFVKDGGNVGIGTTAPEEPLHIVSAGNGGVEIENTSGAPTLTFDMPSNQEARILFKENNALAASIVWDSEAPNPHALIFKGKGTNTEVMRIDPSGNVGIGTDAPTTTLEVNGTMKATGIAIGSAAIDEAELEILDGAIITTTELNYLDNTTSEIQPQLNNKQPIDPTLTSLSSLGTAADKIVYTTGVDTWAEAAITTAGRALIDDADASAQRTTLGLAIGTDVQAYDADLTELATMIGGTAATLADLTSAEIAVLDDAVANTVVNSKAVVYGSSGELAGTLSTTAQANVTSLGTLTALAVDNISINLNTISSTAGTDLNITPLSGQQIVLDDTIVIDAGVVTGATSITSTAFVGGLTGNATTAGTVTTAAQTNITSVGTLSSLAVTGDLTVDTDTLYVDSADNRVGIGTTNPASILQIEAEHPKLTIRSNAANGDGQINFRSGDGSIMANIRCDVTSNLVNHIGIGVNASEDNIVVKSDGNVGIGTTSPNEQLTVEGVMSLKETSAPSLTTGYGKLYALADNKLYFMDEAGTVTNVLAGTSAGSSTYDHQQIDASAIGSNTQYSIAGGDFALTDYFLSVKTGAAGAGYSITILLPSPSGNTGKTFLIKDIGGACGNGTGSTQQIILTSDGGAAVEPGNGVSPTLESPNVAVSVYSNGSNWHIF